MMPHNTLRFDVAPLIRQDEGQHIESASYREVPDLVPARVLNEFSYCPRLAYLEWVQGDFADSADTVEGRHAHRRVDRERGALPEADLVEGERLHARSVLLSAPNEGLIARVDLIESDGTVVTPVDYKRGVAPDIPGGAYEPERVQLCAHALILEENGYKTEGGVLYFVRSKQRVPIAFDAALRERTRTLVVELRRVAAEPALPPPLRDSPKCPRCSLVGICLPDETRLLHDDATEHAQPRRLLADRDDALPLYVHTGGTKVGKRDEELCIETRDEKKQYARLAHTSHLAVFGAVQVSTQAIQELCTRGIPVCYFSAGGWFYGITRSLDHKNVFLRRLQYAVSDDPTRSLLLARRFVVAKIRNGRTMLRRNGGDELSPVVRRLGELAAAAETASSAPALLGIEGTAARSYFEGLARLLKPSGDGELRMELDGRNRRPPADPINALLSLAYALLAKDFTITLTAVGFDALLGFYHRPRYGRPALALDLMEEFRPLIADSTVLSAVNTGVVQPEDFIARGGAVALKEAGRGRFIAAYERRMDTLVTHPVFEYRLSYRRVLELQARLLSRHLFGEIPDYPSFLTR